MSDNPDRVAGGTHGINATAPPALSLIMNKGHNRQALENLAMWLWEAGEHDQAIQLIQAAALYAIATEIGRAAPA